MSTPDFRPARPEDYPAIRALLIEEGLPSEDVAVGQVSRFHLAVQDGELLAWSDALLRSVAVAKCARQNGLGRALVGIAERDAFAIGVSRLFLLTTTAAGYFTALGYERFDRRLAPGSLQSSSQFSLLCPASATCMTKNLL